MEVKAYGISFTPFDGWNVDYPGNLMLITEANDEVNVPDEESAIFTFKDWPRNFDRNIGFTIAPDGSAIIDCGTL